MSRPSVRALPQLLKRLAELYAWERELSEAIAERGPDGPNRTIWLQARRDALHDLQVLRQEYSAAQPAANIPFQRSAA